MIVTSIYSEFWGTEQFRRSLKNVGWELHNAHEGNYKGNGKALRLIYETYLEFKYIHDYAIYMDGADSFVVKKFDPPKDKILYSAEKACWPIASLSEQYPLPKSPWRFLNAGGCSGPIPLLIEFFEKYNLHEYRDVNVTGQLELHRAYLQAIREDFPIELDEMCEHFQTTAFEDEGDFKVANGVIHNNVTKTTPSVFHGNGRTNMDWIYKLYP